jgi:hypothetical protein
MVANITFNPYATTTAGGSFNIDSTGYTQGMALDQPAIRNSLAGGVLANTETLPMWGGVGITELIPGAAGGPNAALGSLIGRATTLTAATTGQLTGFSVFDQNYAAVNNPASPVPLIGSGGLVNFYRLGSGARIPVAIDPSLVSLEGGLITQNVSWDFNNQVLAPYETTATYSITSMTWSSTNGGQAVVVAAVATPVAGVGDVINISGATNSGSGGASLVNGNFTVTAFTDNEHFTIAMPGTSSTIGTIAGTIVANYGTGALAVKVLDIQIGTSMTVVYNPLTGAATWNRSSSTAIILI